jgi:uncharacterized membrane protein SpoIIM required for sporulation
VKDVEGFVASRRPRWQRLEALLDRAERATARELGHDAVEEMVGLYGLACSDLNQARSLTANPELLRRLNQLTGRAYRFIHGAAGARPVRGLVKRFLLEEVPATFRRERRHVLSAAAAMALGALLGGLVVVVDRSQAELLVPAAFFTESPRERVEQIEGGEERIDTLEKALTFGASLYTHNIRVAFLAFSLGALTLVGGHLILFTNGVILGAIAALYHQDGVATFFYAWVGPHGALELPAIVFAGAAGLKLGGGLLLPGDLTVPASLRAVMPAAVRMLVAAMIVLVAAGLIEGSFSQLSAQAVPFAVKIGVAGVLFLGLVAYLFVERRRRAA